MAEPAMRRTLDFRDLDAILADLDQLATRGYDRAGNWDLAQTCGHLADWMGYPMDGYPVPPLPIRILLGALKATIIPGQLKKMLDTRSMPAGGPTMPQTVPAPGGDETAAVDRLRATIARFRDFGGPIQPSPLFGTLDPETCRQLQYIHCAHHLSFLRPRSD